MGAPRSGALVREGRDARWYLKGAPLLRRACTGKARRDLKPERTVGVIMRRVVQTAGAHVELPELLLERHAREQVAHARVDRQAGIAVGRRVGRLRVRGGWRGEQTGEERGRGGRRSATGSVRARA